MVSAYLGVGWTSRMVPSFLRKAYENQNTGMACAIPYPSGQALPPEEFRGPAAPAANEQYWTRRENSAPPKCNKAIFTFFENTPPTAIPRSSGSSIPWRTSWGTSRTGPRRRPTPKSFSPDDNPTCGGRDAGGTYAEHRGIHIREAFW